MKYDRTIVAYHGCDAEAARRLLDGDSFKKSQNDYDWLGEGIFWEYGADRALQFAHFETDAQRLDVNNGLLLGPNLDAAFDRGLITFDDAGRITMSTALGDDARASVGIDDSLRAPRCAPRTMSHA
jgi:hypothetical protein